MPEEPEPTPLPPVDDAGDAYIEKRAEELGLPTDPEAYKDGGLGVAATAPTVAEADLLAALLNGRGIPAWVNSPRAIVNAAPAGSASVMVPMGRLADAQEMLSRREQHDAASDPEAYLEEDCCVAATTTQVAHADMLTAILKSRGIPAWVDSDPTSLTIASPARPFSVMVPEGRLTEAEAVLAEGRAEAAPEEADQPRSKAPRIILILTLAGGQQSPS